MTYLGFLGLFLGIPLVLLAGLVWRDQRNGKDLPLSLQSWPAWQIIALLIVIAVLYTTPWDNYLVATRVWWYEPDLVTGLVLGWVPLEEYIFFVGQTIFTGLWLLWLARRIRLPDQFNAWPRLRWISTLTMALIWLASVTILAVGWPAGSYLALELVWALLPIMLQLAFGADILFYYVRLVLWTIVPATLYLSIADMIAINSGTWTIDPSQSLNIFLLNILPIEEFIFFLLTNTLVTFGLTLALSRESHQRLGFMSPGLTDKSNT